MADETGISWVRNTDGTAGSTFNPWIGCEKVSPGCAHCYAETLVTGRMGRAGTWGAEGVRQRTTATYWRHPLSWNRDAEARGIRRRVFCASLADVFEPRPELVQWRYDLFRLIAETPHLDWLLLTKRPDEALAFLERLYEYGNRTDLGIDRPMFGREWTSRDGLGWGMLPNIWIGTSIENARFTWRADVLREIPATVRFLSCEPLLGSLYSNATDTRGRAPLDLAGVRRDADPPSDAGRVGEGPSSPQWAEEQQAASRRAPLDLTGIDWIICGGESGGKQARPTQVEWVREIRDAVLSLRGEPDEHGYVECHGCQRLAPADQLEQWCSGFDHHACALRVGLPRLHFKQWGSHDATGTYRGSSPTSGGKALDGIEWCEIPEPRVGALA